MAKHAGVARHAWNWGLALCQQLRADGVKRPTAIDLHKRLVAEVKTANPWYYELSKCAPQESLRNLDKAFKSAFTVKRRGFPKFKKKNVKDSFYLEGSIRITGNRIKLPKIGWVRTFEQLPCATPKNIIISKRAGEWYIAFKVEVPEPVVNQTGLIVGVDVGINALATCSDGTTFANPKAYRKAKVKLRRLHKSLSRKEKGSKNRAKAQMKLAKAHLRIANIRKDSLHKCTTYLAKNHSVVVIEDLNVSGMLKNHKLASAIADCGFYEFRRQLEYKTQWYGSQLHVVGRFYPSTKTCSACGHTQPMPLQARTFECGSCPVSINRDLNAALNLAVSYTVSACGESKLQDFGSVALSEAGIQQPIKLV